MMIGRTLGHYRITGKLGSGGMGEVFFAEDVKLARRVALKILPPEMASSEERRKRFEREARAIAALSHPGILAIHDFGEAEGISYAVMELLEGTTLRELLAQGPLTSRKAAEYAKQIAEGLSAAHGKGIIHRDLKPENLFVTEDGRIKILDFGLAKVAAPKSQEESEDAPTRTRSTEPGIVMGTPGYMSPEQARGQETDHRTDLFSLGAVLYEMVAGEQAFRGHTTADVLSAILRDDPPELSQRNQSIPRGMDRIVRRCLEKRTGERFQTARDVVFALDALDDPEGAEESGAQPSHTVTPIEVPSFVNQHVAPVEPRYGVFVAREGALAWLEDLLAKSMDGRAQVGFVTGDAGCGKTSLLREFASRALEAHGDLIVATGSCNVFAGTGDPYLPFRGVMGMLTADVESEWASGGITRDHALRLWNAASRVTEALVEHGPDLLGRLVPSAELEARARAFAPRDAPWLDRLAELAVGDQHQANQNRLFEQCTGVLSIVARPSPLVLVLEDLHWADSSSATLLLHLARNCVDSHLLILGTYRPEEVTQAPDGEPAPLQAVLTDFKRHFGDISLDLNQTGKEEGRLFVEALLDAEPNQFDDAFRDSLADYTTGHPLFTVELIRDMRDRGDIVQDAEGFWIEGPGLSWDSLPARAEGVIEQRIARLAPELQEILSVASLEGEVFTAEAVAAVLQSDEREMIRRLSGELDKKHQLVAAQGVHRTGSRRLSRYRFGHALFQRFFYKRMDDVERAYQHEALGDALENLYGANVDEISVALGRHYQEAGVLDKAVEYLGRAGNRALKLSANQEAIEHFNLALVSLKELSESPERDEKELRLLTALGPALIAAKGYVADEVEEAYNRARELCRRVGDAARLFQVLQGQTLYHRVRGELAKAHALGEELLALAEDSSDPALLLEAHFSHGATVFHRGELAKAKEHLEKSLELYDAKAHEALAFVYAQDPGVVCESRLAWVYWLLGYPDQAVTRARKGLELAKERSHPLSLALSSYFAAMLYALRREAPRAEELSAMSITVSKEKGLPHFEAGGAIIHGWALVAQGQVEEGVAEARAGVDFHNLEQAELNVPIYLSLMAEALRAAGQSGDARAAIDIALEIAHTTGDVFYEAELVRLRGELLLESGGPEAQAEKCFREAVEIASSQGARSLELRAWTSLCRLGIVDATGPLAALYGSFEEGPETHDLKEAKKLID